MLPVKRFAAAKKRLRPGLEEERRGPLIAAMLEDVLEAISAARLVERTIVVSGDPAAITLAEAAGAEVLPDPSDEGHSEAALLGIARAEEEGASCVVLLPGDCPLLDPRELDSLLTAVPERYVAVVPDRHGTGTNALVISPPNTIRPAFGPGSRERHVAAAREAGVPFAVEEASLPGARPRHACRHRRPGDRVEADRSRAARTAGVLGI